MLAKPALIAFGLGLCVTAPAPPPRQETPPAPIRSSSSAPPRVSFEKQIRPVLEARCRPCHFAGGKMYERLPFDRPETIQRLGDKLFTRIKDTQEQALLRSFLAQKAPRAGDSP
ncbi:MAG TPA: hypothetical protein VGX68_13850 [Thermoanaerobaculia bacterium]|jgi:hypothetical protein|nr:hypothetical protein [Thermoanaerobaculia bacterium]